ncbi:MAG: hypothetical protein ACOC44_09060 [Promethearchaeia archaeon]
MLEDSNFKNKALRRAQEYFKEVHMTQEQHEIFNRFIDIFLKHIPIDKMAAKGIGWRCIREWQLKHKRDLLGLEIEDPEERVKSISQLLQIVKKELIGDLVDEEDIPLVDEAINNILDFYKEKYAHR